MISVYFGFGIEGLYRLSRFSYIKSVIFHTEFIMIIWVYINLPALSKSVPAIQKKSRTRVYPAFLILVLRRALYILNLFLANYSELCIFSKKKLDKYAFLKKNWSFPKNVIILLWKLKHTLRLLKCPRQARPRSRKYLSCRVIIFDILIYNGAIKRLHKCKNVNI